MLSKVLGAVGAVLVLAGVIIGVRPVSASGMSCGSVFQPAAGITPMACDSRLSHAGIIVAAVVGAGLALVAAGISIATVRNRQDR